MSLPKGSIRTAFDGVEALLDDHARTLRSRGWRLRDDERVLTTRKIAGTKITVGTICLRGKTRTVLGVSSEFHEW